jgi:hypothetical protein
MNSCTSVSYLITASTGQGWVDYKIFVVCYNYSYFKNYFWTEVVRYWLQLLLKKCSELFCYFATLYFLVLLYLEHLLTQAEM